MYVECPVPPQKIVDWYTEILFDGVADQILPDCVKFLTGTVQWIGYSSFNVIYFTSETMMWQEQREFEDWFVNPDEDGNYPITDCGEEHLVRGAVIG